MPTSTFNIENIIQLDLERMRRIITETDGDAEKPWRKKKVAKKKVDKSGLGVGDRIYNKGCEPPTINMWEPRYYGSGAGNSSTRTEFRWLEDDLSRAQDTESE